MYIYIYISPAAVTRQKCHELDIIVRNEYDIMYGGKKKKEWKKMEKQNGITTRSLEYIILL